MKYSRVSILYVQMCHLSRFNSSINLLMKFSQGTQGTLGGYNISLLSCPHCTYHFLSHIKWEPREDFINYLLYIRQCVNKQYTKSIIYNPHTNAITILIWRMRKLKAREDELSVTQLIADEVWALVWFQSLHSVRLHCLPKLLTYFAQGASVLFIMLWERFPSIQ